MPKTFENIILVDAVDGRKLTAKEYYDKTVGYFIKTKKIMSPSELGCTLSHIKALELFLSSDNSFALILEDDVIGNDKDIEKTHELTKSLDENFLFLCGAQEGLSSKKYQLGKVSNNIEGFYEVCAFSYEYIFRTCCYIVSRKSAQLILDYHNKNTTLADKWDEFFINTNVKIYYSNILSHPEDLENSHIEKDRANFKNQTFIEKIFSFDVFVKIYNKLYREVLLLLYKILGHKKL